VYVPAQYDGTTEVSLMVFNDGPTYAQPDGYYRAVNVLDNLIHRGELPVMIAAFIAPANPPKMAPQTGRPSTMRLPTAIHA
jgi:enterochelin esterase family protein